ncbi:MAG: Gfo/Idh/MocA family oxidoreductase [SAR324 cluster bacterium]|nr:Gfo/Idh/MocA family oxidoreductase [SAR324 cluster bacterium]
MSTQLKCGIVGYGYMGEIRKRVIEESEHLELVGVVEPSEKHRKKVKGCPTWETFEDLLKTDPDIIFVATPNRYAPEISHRSMSLGKHVFCEKPPGRNLEDIKYIIEAEKANPGVKLMFGFNHRFHPAILKAKSIVDSGRMGKVIGIRGLYGKSGGVNFPDSWRNNKYLSGGGILLDQGIHMLDLFRFFCGDFEFVKCFIDNSYWKMEVEDNAYVILSNTRGQNAAFHSSATLWKHTFRLELVLTEGYMTIEGLLSKTGSYGRERIIIGRRQFENETEAVGNPSEEIIYFDKDMSWELEMQTFIDCIQNDKPVTLSSSHDALMVMEIIEKAYQDAKINKG